MTQMLYFESKAQANKFSINGINSNLVFVISVQCHTLLVTALGEINKLTI